MSCTDEENTCDIVATFRRRPVIGRPGHCVPLAMPLVWHFATKCAAVKFAVRWMLNHFSSLREYNYISSARYPECPTEDWWGKPCWLNPWQSDPDVVQGLGGVTASPTLLDSILVWSEQNYLKLLLTVSFSKFSCGCCPRNPP